MTSENTIYKQATLAFNKLQVAVGDIVVVKFPPGIHPEQMQIVANSMQETVPDGVSVLCTRAAVTIETLSETEMNAQGWYKFDTTKVN